MKKARITKQEQNYGYDSIFPTTFRKLLDERGKTQEELADFVGVSRQSIAQWKDGKTKPDILYLTKIAKFFDVSADYLLGRQICFPKSQATKSNDQRSDHILLD